MIQARLTDQPIAPELLAQLDAPEAAGAGEVSARADTMSIIATDGGKLIGYAVIGRDAGGIVAVYYARALVPVLGPMVMKQFFGAAAILGDPVRVHTERLEAMARAFGANVVIDGIDADGVPVGVFG